MNELATNSGNDGFCYSTSPVATRPNSLGNGSKNLLLVGSGKLVAHQGIAVVNAVTGARSLFQIPDGGYAGLGDGSHVGTGSIFGLIARAIAFIGATSNLTINGSSRAVNASTALQILLYKSGSYSGAGTGPYTAGIARMLAPVVAVTPNASTVNSGTTSAVTWFVRSATGGRGRKSSPSAVLIVDGFKVRVTINASDLTAASSNGYDRIGIGVTKWGFGATGPHYEFIEIAISSLTTVDTVANSYEIEWSAAQLDNLAPLDDFPPPAAVFGAALEDVICVIGAYGDVTSGVSATSPGTAIAISLPVFIESFPPDNLLFLPGASIGVLPNPSGGFAFAAGLNYLCALTYTGGSPALSLQTLWASIGIAHQNAMFLGEGGRLYVFTNGKRGVARIGEQGEPDTAFASDISDYVSGWNPANVVGGRDNDYQLNVFCHAREAICFNSQLERWCAPLDFSNQLTANEVICAAVTINGALYLASRDTVSTGTALKLWTLHGGSGTTWDAWFQWNRSASVSDDVMLVEAAVRADNTSNPITVEICKNGSDTPVRSQSLMFRGSTTPTTGLQHGILKADERGAKSHRIHLRGVSTGGDSGPEAVKTTGETSEVIF
jgi:hypothetical protein